MQVMVRDLIKVFKLGNVEVHALRGVNLDVDKGELVSIIGPSGSGKTTLLNIMGGLDQATAGLVRVGETEVTALSLSQLVDYRRRVVGHIFQNLNLVPTLTAEENVELAMIAMGTPRTKRTKRAAELLEIVGLSPRAKHRPEELSGGEQQRVAIASALANDPELVLADEPTGELDTVNAQIVVDFLLKVNKELGKTIIMVTHDPAVARVSHRILRIEDGRIKAELAPTEAYAQGTTQSLIDQLRARITEIDAETTRLDAQFKGDLITSDKYLEARIRLRQLRDSLLEELHRLGVTAA